MKGKILLAGESWMTYSTHVKGADSYTTATYEEGGQPLIDALTKGGFEVTYIRNHEAINFFPNTADELAQYDCVLLSDIGSNTLLLRPETMVKSKIMPNRLELLRDYVLAGGACVMIGGYYAFSGIDGKARYGTTPLQEVLPVQCLEHDDREEHPEGVLPAVSKKHPVLDGIPEIWPPFLGYNKTLPICQADIIMTINGDPLLAIKKSGKGRSAVFTSDCSPHWGTPEFVSWEYYAVFWCQLVSYLIGK